jgi:nicotinamide mononucleotide transporter
VSHLEILSALIALSGVLFTALGKTIGWPLGIIGAFLYVLIFFENQLYAETVLQGIYVLMGFFGWLNWRSTLTGKLRFNVTHQSVYVFIFSVLIIGIGTLLTGYLLDKYSDTKVPFIDACLGVSGLVVTWQMAKKQLECWIWWIVVDVASSILFFYKEMIATSLLYLVFAAFAMFGFVKWKKELLQP